jgi:hypothetical protein
VSEPPFDPLLALRVLDKHGVRFILIGGFAASIRGSPVITGDLDLCYARDDRNMEALVAALQELDAKLRGAPADVPFQLDAQSIRNGDHFTFIASAGRLDCLGTPAGTAGYKDLDSAATDEDLDGLKVRVASLEDLVRMKRAAGRKKDEIALEWLGALQEELERGPDAP